MVNPPNACIDQFNQGKIDIPALLGYNIMGPLRVVAGPALELVVNFSFDLEEFKELESNDVNLNLHVGLGLVFNRFDIDLRWEKGITDSETVFFTDFNLATVTFNTTANPLILNVTYRFRFNHKK